MKRAVYPGSFDPVTYGHLDIIKRASTLADELIVGVLVNPAKSPLFMLEERVDILKKVTADIPNVRVEHFSGLLVNFVSEMGARIVVKGLRALSDFDIEFQMALMNRKLAENQETIFLMTSDKYAFLSSSMVKDIYRLGGKADCLVPPYVSERLQAKYANLQNQQEGE